MRAVYCIAMLLLIVVAVVFPAGYSRSQAQSHAPACTPTPPDMLGPFYKPGAPVRSKVGEGYVLTGVARSSATCEPIKGAQIEFWLAGPEGRYDDRYRARVFTDDRGAYRFESNYPPAYGGRPPHLHLRVSAEGYETLVTQHYPERGGGTGR